MPTTVDPNNPGASTIEDVQNYLAEHPEDAATVLAAEQARGDQARSTLVNSLQDQSGQQPSQQSDQAQSREGEEGEVVKPEDERISPPGEYPSENTWGYGDKSLVDQPSPGEGESGS